MSARLTTVTVYVLACWSAAACGGDERPRARDLGIEIGIFPPGKWNVITDVSGVLVGHATVDDGDDIHTGVTAILPHPGNLFRET